MEMKNIVQTLKKLESKEIQLDQVGKKILEHKVLSEFLKLLVEKTLTNKELQQYSWGDETKLSCLDIGLFDDYSQPKYNILTLAKAYGLIGDNGEFIK